MRDRQAVWRWLGRVPFADTAREQERLRDELLRGAAPETLLLCEHDPVVTLGRSANPAHVLAPRAELARRGVTLATASRGGDVTYHGPGQLVGYPIVRLRGGVIGHVTAMARAIASVLAELGIDARWRRDAPGVWVGDANSERGAKICAFGVHVHRRVAIHGFALNVAARLADDGDGFGLIVPCGLRGTRTTSIGAVLGAGRAAPPLHVLASRVAGALGRELGVGFVPQIESPATPWEGLALPAIGSARQSRATPDATTGHRRDLDR
jgi:lipoyl(octanoyl) transferase